MNMTTLLGVITTLMWVDFFEVECLILKEVNFLL